MYPGIAEALCRLLHVVIEPVYAPLQPFPSPDVHLDLYPPPHPTLNHRVQERASIGRKVATPKYAFFYPDWNTGLLTVSDYGNAVKVLRVLLGIVGGHLSKDIRLVYKILRIGKAHVLQVDFFFSLAVLL
jgi:hypothetical protein